MAFVLCVLFSPRVVFAQGYAQLELPGHADRIIFEDLNGDGRVDLYVHEGKSCHIFYNLPGKGYGVKAADKTSRQADLILNLPKKARLHLKDLDGDKLPEFVAVGNGQVCVFRNLGAKGFNLQPDSVFKTNPEDLFVSLEDVDADGKSDLAVFNNKTVRWHKGDGAKFAAGGQEIHRLSSPLLPEGLSFVGSEKPLLRRFVANLDGKAPADIFVPEKEGFLILLREGDKTTVKKLLSGITPCTLAVYISGQTESGGRTSVAPRFLQAVISLPELCQLDKNQFGAKIEPHWVLSDGHFGTNLNLLMQDPEKPTVPKEGEKYVELLPVQTPRQLDTWHNWENDLDVDGDGTPDRVDYRNDYAREGPFQTTIVTLYRRDPKTGDFFTREKDGKPGITCNLKDSNFLRQPVVRDFNGDKYPDVLMLNSNFGLGDLDKILKTQFGEFDATLHIFYFNPEKRAWDKDNSFTRQMRFSFKLKFLYFIVGEQGLDQYLDTFLNLEGNFGGDAGKDLLARPDNSHLNIHFFRPEKDGGPFREKPDLTFEGLPDFEKYSFYDFNNDGLTDIMLNGKVTGKEGEREMRVLLLSNGEK